MKYLFGVIVILYAISVDAQPKPRLSESDLNEWPSLGRFAISNNGEFLLYIIENVPVGSNTLLISAADRKWEFSVSNVNDIYSAKFSECSRYIYYRRNEVDSFTRLTLGSNKMVNVIRSEDFPDRPLETMPESILPDSLKSVTPSWESPDHKSVIIFMKGDYFYFNGKTNKLVNLTKTIQNKWSGTIEDDADFMTTEIRGIAGWSEDSEQVFIYDQNDIWQFNLANLGEYRNVTHKLGVSSSRVFYLPTGNNINAKITTSSRVILISFNKKTKMNGFYELRLDGSCKLTYLSEFPKLFFNANAILGVEAGALPIKARDAEVYLVKQMSADSSPNLYLTRDFIHFNQISFISPEARFNWLTTELITLNPPGVQSSLGILYKPENFDSSIKYPVIFYYYRKLSDNLHAYIKPAYSYGRLNIPYYVSNGYLIVTPDIYYELGKTGNSALTYVMAAVESIKKLPFVDTSRLGIQGVSFGSFETNYIVTHTPIFKAACTSSGLSNIISAYNSINSGNPKNEEFELGGPYQIGYTLWERPDLYIKNTPLFNAHHVATPLLIMHTSNDGTVPMNNALEFFLALQRLKKKAWLLQYEKGNHGVEGIEAVDFNSKMKDFFDFYLKDGDLPAWMK